MCATICIIVVIIIFLLYIISNSYEHYTNISTNISTTTAPYIVLYCPYSDIVTNSNYSICNKLTRTMEHWNGFVQYAKRYMPYLKINKINYATSKTNRYPTVVLYNKLGRMIIYHGDITMHNLIRFVNNHS